MIWKLFAIDINNLIKTEAILCKNFRMPPSEIERLPFWQYEMFMSELGLLVEAENKEYEGIRDGTAKPNSMYGKMMKNYGGVSSGIDKMTKNIGNMKMPDFSNMTIKMPGTD